MKICNSNYPYNVIQAIIENHFNGNVPEEFKEVSSTQVVGFNGALSLFDERTQKIFILRWKDGRTLKDIGKEVHLSQERIRQILSQTLFFLSFRYFNIVRYGEEEIERRRKKKEEEEKIEKFPTIILSARPFHVLRRAGIFTVGELLKMTKNDFLAFRSLGRKSVIEVLLKISDFRKEFGEDVEKFSGALLKMKEK